MGIRRRGRGVPTYDPNTTYFTGGLLLCFTFGMMLVGIHESVMAEDWAWFWFFMACELGCVVLYFLNVWWWLDYPTLSDDYMDVDSTVEWWHGQHHHYPGDR